MVTDKQEKRRAQEKEVAIMFLKYFLNAFLVLTKNLRQNNKLSIGFLRKGTAFIKTKIRCYEKGKT